MSDNVVQHPKRGLMTEAKIERELADSPEAQALQTAICLAVQAYADYLERHGILWEFGVDPEDPDWLRMKAQALVITMDFGEADGIDIALQGGALDRVYGDRVNPDPFGFDADLPLPI